MNKVLLRSHSLNDFQPIGEHGKPVYQSAIQLRETLRLRGRQNAAESLAIPQMNEAGDRIDWYSAFSGSVVPWSSASETERANGLLQLEKIHEELIEVSDSLQGSEKKEQVLFASLLQKARQFPDSTHIYLVNGRPVVTFWGFLNNLESIRFNPLDCLAIPKAKPIQPVIEPAAIIEEPVIVQKRHWLWWLLLLLLLLLLLIGGYFLLRALAPPDVKASLPTFGLPGLTTPELTVPEVSLPDLSLPDANLPNVDLPNVALPNVTLPNVNLPNVNLPNINLPDVTLPNVNLPDVGLGALSGGEIGEGAVDLPLGDEALSEAELTAEEGLSASGEGEVPPVEGEAPSAPVEAPPAEGEAPPVSGEAPPAEGAAPPAPGEAPPAEGSAPPALGEAPPAEGAAPPESGEAPPAKPLSIPEAAKTAQSADFLNGEWRATGGIQDAKTGKPLALTYDFNEGQGKAKVTRSDGVVCEGTVNAGMQSGALGINNQSAANCSDGSNYTLPEIVCTQEGGVNANCKGQYENGVAFPINMKTSAK